MNINIDGKCLIGIVTMLKITSSNGPAQSIDGPAPFTYGRNPIFTCLGLAAFEEKAGEYIAHINILTSTQFV